MGTITAGLEGVIAGESEICYHRRIPGHPQLPRLQHSHPGGQRHFRRGHLPPLERLAAQTGRTGPAQAGTGGRARPSRAGGRFSAERSGRQPDGRAAHGRLDAEHLRSRSAGHVGRGQSPQGGAPDVEDGHHRHHLRPPAQEGSHPSRRSEARILREFPLHPDRQAARRHHGARLRRGPDPARRSRTERLHLCRARHRRHPVRHLLLDHQRHRRAEGTAARRRQSGRDQVAAANWATRTRPSSACATRLPRR